MTERDALWWEVQGRIARTPELLDQLWKYLLGTEDFATAALDALEEAAYAECPECGGLGSGDDDGEDPHTTAAEKALARYGQGEPAARVLVDLLEEILGAKPLADIARVRLSAQCEALRSRIEKQNAELSKLTGRIDKNVQELAALEAELAALAPPSAKVPASKG